MTRRATASATDPRRSPIPMGSLELAGVQASTIPVTASIASAITDGGPRVPPRDDPSGRHKGKDRYTTRHRLGYMIRPLTTHTCRSTWKTRLRADVTSD
jgi:hypothetical protein